MSTTYDVRMNTNGGVCRARNTTSASIVICIVIWPWPAAVIECLLHAQHPTSMHPVAAPLCCGVGCQKIPTGRVTAFNGEEHALVIAENQNPSLRFHSRRCASTFSASLIVRLTWTSSFSPLLPSSCQILGADVANRVSVRPR